MLQSPCVFPENVLYCEKLEWGFRQIHNSEVIYSTTPNRVCQALFEFSQDKRILFLEEERLRAKERFRILTQTGYPT